jgi:hypothetical protein
MKEKIPKKRRKGNYQTFARTTYICTVHDSRTKSGYENN